MNTHFELHADVPISAQAWRLSELIREGALSHPILWVVANAHLAASVSHELLSRLPKHHHRQVLLFPDWETLPYDRYPPHPHLIASRLRTLHQLGTHPPLCLITNASNLLYRCVSPSWIQKSVWRISPSLDRSQCLKQLEHVYERSDQLRHEGQYVLRGSLIDMHPIQGQPLRLDFVDDKLDAIIVLDKDDYRPLKRTAHFDLMPRFEVNQCAQKTDWIHQLSYVDPPFTARLRTGALVPGYHYYLPCYHDDLVSLPEHLPHGAQILMHTDAQESMKEHWALLHSRYDRHHGSPILPPDAIAFPPEHFCSSVPSPKAWAEPMTIPFEATQFAQPHECFIISTKTESRRPLLEQYLKAQSIPVHPSPTHRPGVFIAEHTLTEGFRIPSLGTTYLKEEQLYQTTLGVSRLRAEERAPESALGHEHYHLGQKVVHRDYGVGLLEDLVDITTTHATESFFKLRYAHDKIIYIPIDNLVKITPYYGQADLDDPGHSRWQQRLQRAREACEAYAAHLLTLEARRHSMTSPSIQCDESFDLFCRQFYFEETPDQLKCMREILEDMAKTVPMDRLLLGDVGFGKTEVLLRAAFACIMSGYQVIMLCPTTILAEQHTQSARERMGQWPIRIALHSRLEPKSRQEANLKAFLAGDIDFIIGTHGLLSVPRSLKRLGLLIIDEEHRFGVKDKQKLIDFYPNIHRISVSATPIPRTLQASLQELRGISFIHTPPKHRLPVETIVSEHHDELIKEAVIREVQRGGQLFVIHNEIDTQSEWSAWFESHFPHISTTTLHAQMPERTITHTMNLFLSGVHQVLICTTLIESGIDIPNANTIIIHRADLLGLAQLHQLRGRVGRSHHQGYAYFLHPPLEKHSDAYARLEALKTYTQLGSGWLLSVKDLELRGAGSWLGEEQTGHMDHMGYACYQQLLQEAIEHHRKGETGTPGLCELELKSERYIPSHYIADLNTRLRIYQDIGRLSSLDALNQYEQTLSYHHGLLPTPTQHLLDHHRLRLLASASHVASIVESQKKLVWQWRDATYLETERLFELARMPQSGITFTHNLGFSVPMDGNVYGQCLNLLQLLSTHPLIRG